VARRGPVVGPHGDKAGHALTFKPDHSMGDLPGRKSYGFNVRI
jgi:hypothetical protein